MLIANNVMDLEYVYFVLSTTILNKDNVQGYVLLTFLKMERPECVTHMLKIVRTVEDQLSTNVPMS